MQESYIPKWEENDFCASINLCTVRKTDNWISKIWIKYLTGEVREAELSEIINSDTFEWKKIIRIYSSWHIFLSEDLKKVFLVTTSKDWKTQHQFTWWSPMEEENKEVITNKDWAYKFDLNKVRANARIRTLNRTWVDVTEEYNDVPLVDWVLMENEEDWVVFFKLICLMHFIVKECDWKPWFTLNENVIWADWYDIDDLPNIANVAPNAYVVSKNAREIVENWEIL
ncbi:MAG: hypothetical protein ACD_2C00193G0023 [uncultured bacterium (gcode 4)]|uniref:Uncharacterized protein n=1 Tax=uncultured bacterium (gcode 4) TaxID=1234023 RepID=K2G4Q2_9BACT|nr:MAG: hypothetical protein ACD_2C00193G0023 [uncultured bacterium (gcode 4)]